MTKPYIQYQHIERLDSDEVEGILEGTVHVFPKIDGTNAQIWFNGEEFFYGSRRRRLVPGDNDNHGFSAWADTNNNLKGTILALCMQQLGKGTIQSSDQLHVFGEWLVPHTLKTYRPDAWRKFYVFDIGIETENGLRYIPFDDYEFELKQHAIDYISPIVSIKNAQQDKLYDWLDKNTFLIEDGKGVGEGLVIKNYDFVNKYGRQTWAKIVTSEFKEKHVREMGHAKTEYADGVEQKIVDKYLMLDIVDKAVANIAFTNQMDFEGHPSQPAWSSKDIPQLLSTVYHDLIIECLWDATKKYKNPTINFKVLQRECNRKVKELKPELF